MLPEGWLVWAVFRALGESFSNYDSRWPSIVNDVLVPEFLEELFSFLLILI